MIELWQLRYLYQAEVPVRSEDWVNLVTAGLTVTALSLVRRPRRLIQKQSILENMAF
jgi:hypothetical protein